MMSIFNAHQIQPIQLHLQIRHTHRRSLRYIHYVLADELERRMDETHAEVVELLISIYGSSLFLFC